MEGCDNTYEKLKEIMITDQVMATYRKDLRVFLTERGTGSLEDIATLADRFDIAHQHDKGEKGPPGNRENKLGQNSLSQPFESRGGDKQDGPPPFPRRVKQEGEGEKEKVGGVEKEWRRCFNCNRKGHYKWDCPLREISACASTHAENPNVTKVTVSGREVSCLLDTGMTLGAMIRADLVKPQAYTGEFVCVQYANCNMESLPLAHIEMDSAYIKGKVKAAISPSLAYPVILGNKYVRARPLMRAREREEADTHSRGESKEGGVTFVNPRRQVERESGVSLSPVNVDETDVRQTGAGVADGHAAHISSQMRQQAIKCGGGGRQYHSPYRRERRFPPRQKGEVSQATRTPIQTGGQGNPKRGHVGTGGIPIRTRNHPYWSRDDKTVKRGEESYRGSEPMKLCLPSIGNQLSNQIGMDLARPMVPGPRREWRCRWRIDSGYGSAARPGNPGTCREVEPRLQQGHRSPSLQRKKWLRSLYANV